LVGALFDIPADAEVNYKSISSMNSKWECNGDILPVHVTQTLEGTLELNQFTLSNLTLDTYDLNQPGQIVELIEMQRWRNKPLPFFINDSAPYLHFSEKFLQRNGGFHIFSSNTLAGFLGDDLHQLMQLSDLSLTVDKPIEIKSHFQKLDRKQTILLKEISEEFIVVEITTVVDRQKVFLDSGDFAVVFGQSIAIWTINRRNGLQFNIREEGNLTTSVKVLGIDARQVHEIKREVLNLI
jgi:hypothetical protein